MKKDIKGQAWLSGDTLLQTITTFEEDGSVTEHNDVLVEDIWADLLSDSGTYKVNETKRFFYWEYMMTDSENDDLEVKILFSCPTPKPDLDLEKGSGEWVEYWKKRIETYKSNFEKRSTIQPQTVDLGSYNYMNPATGQIENRPAESYERDGLSDIQNLLFLF